MPAFKDLPQHQQSVLEDAAAWQMRLRASPQLRQSAEFRTWLEDDMNCRAMQAIDLACGSLEIADNPELAHMRRDVWQRAMAGSAHKKISRRTLWKTAAAMLLSSAGGGAAWYILHSPQTYRTGTGVRRTLTLSDGSRIALDSNSEIQVRYSKNARKIVLNYGQARFDVAHDKKRPFSVTAGQETVIAVGTSFNVEKLQQKVLVTLIHGNIVVKNSADHTEQTEQKMPVSLDAGQELEAVKDTPPVVRRANIKATTAWVTGQLIFHATTLKEATERENRYTDNPVIVDPRVSDIKINGVFNAGDIASFVNAVTSYFPVQATTNSDDQIILQPRA